MKRNCLAYFLRPLSLMFIFVVLTAGSILGGIFMGNQSWVRDCIENVVKPLKTNR